MKKIIIGIIVAGAALTSLAAGAAFTYQGVLQTSTGDAMTGTRTVEFRLYSQATGGSALWGRAYTVLLDTNGLFNVELSDTAGSALQGGPTTPLSQVFASNADRSLYIGMTVTKTSGEVLPRQKLLAVPYATFALDVREARGDFTVAGKVTAVSASVTDLLSANRITTTGAMTIGGDLAVTGAITGFGSVPVGGIIMWSGSMDEIPSGWAICDGETHEGQATPDLRNRFVVGAGSSYRVGDKGGADTVTLTTTQMPSHSHTVYGRSSGYAGAHNNSHEVITYANKDWGSWSEKINDTESAGGGQAHENRPPYYALCFIMRVK